MKFFRPLSLIVFVLYFGCEQNVKKKPVSVSDVKPITTTTYYLIRHAEKDRTDPSDSNPPLSEIGMERAQKWKDLFKNTKFSAIYSTDYNRTMATAKPIAEQHGLDIRTYDPNDFDFEKFKEDTKGKDVLIVGHSNTAPHFVNQLIGMDKYKDMDDSDNATFFMVTIVNDDIIHKKYAMETEFSEKE